MTTRYRNLLMKNLRRIMSERDITAAEMSRAIKIPQTTISKWMNGTRTPRDETIDQLCEYLKVTPSDLVGDPNAEPHYLNPETEQIAQEIMDNHELKMLFDASRDASPDELRLLHSMILALKKKENHEE